MVDEGVSAERDALRVVVCRRIEMPRQADWAGGARPRFVLECYLEISKRDYQTALEHGLTDRRFGGRVETDDGRPATGATIAEYRAGSTFRFSSLGEANDFEEDLVGHLRMLAAELRAIQAFAGAVQHELEPSRPNDDETPAST